MSSHEVPRRRRVLRRLGRVALWLVALSFLLRLALVPGLPFALERVGAARGLDVTLEDLRLSVLRGTLHLRGLAVRPTAEEGAGIPPTLLELDLLDFDLDLLALLRGRLRVVRAEVDGLHLRVERDAGGRIAWLAALGAEGQDGREVEGPPAPGDRDAGAGAPRLPFELVQGRLQQVRVVLRDAAVEPPVDVELELHLRAAHLGSRERPGELDLVLHSRQVCDGLSLRGSLAERDGGLAGELSLVGRGLRAGPLAPWLAALGLQPRAERWDLAAALSARVASTSPGADGRGAGLDADLGLHDLSLLADGREALALDALELNAEGVGSHSVRLELVRAAGLRVEVERLAGGELAFARLALVDAPVGASPAPRAKAPTAEATDTAPRAHDAATTPALELTRAVLEGAALRFTDHTLEPPLALELRPALELSGLVLDPARPEAQAALSLELAAPGLFESLRLSGPLRPGGERRGLELELVGRGIELSALAPLLARAGLETTFERAELQASLAARLAEQPDGSLEGACSLERLRLVAGDESLLELDALALRDAHLAADGGMRLGEVALEGLALSALRGASGELSLMGLRTRPRAAGPAPAAAREAAAAPDAAPRMRAVDSAPAPAAGAPPLALERLAVRGTRLAWRDEALAEPLELVLSDLGLELTGLALGGPPGIVGEPARLALWLRAPEHLGDLALSGSLALAPALRVALDLSGTDLTLSALAPYLAPLGLEPAFATSEGTGELRLALELAVGPDGGPLDLRLTELALRAGGIERAGLDGLDVRGLVSRPEGLSVERIVVASPRLVAERDGAGALELLGLRLLPPSATAEHSAGAELAAPPAPSTDGDEPGHGPAAPASRLRIGDLLVVGAHLGWNDRSHDPPLATALEGRVALRDLELGPGAGTTRIELFATLDGSLDRFELSGEARLDPQDFSSDLRVVLEGLRAGTLGEYIPAQLGTNLRDGRLTARWMAQAGRAEQGGRRARLAVEELEFAERGGAPLLRLARLVLDAPRIDPGGGEVRLAELALEGLELEVRRRADGGFSLLGLELGGAPASERAADERSTEAAQAPAAAAGAAPSRPALPEVWLERLALGVERLRVVDEAHPDAPPLDLRLVLESPRSQLVLSPEPESLAPLELRLVGHALPAVGEIRLDLRASPLAQEPELELELRLGGLSGAGLLALLPELAATVDGAGLEQGEFRARLAAELRARRRSPLEYDLDAGLGAELVLSEVALRPRPDAPVALGLESLRVDAALVRAARGEVHVREIEIVKPRLHARRSAQGLAVAGLVLRPRAPGEAAPDRAPDAAPAPPARAPAPAGEVRIDRLVAHGIDVEFTDDSVEPALHLPLADLDLEVAGITTRALAEPVPIRFRASLAAGEVPLASRVRGAPPALRPAFGELATSGSLSLFPAPEGWVKLELFGFELANLRGLAAAAGVELTDGLYDARLDVRLAGERGLRVTLDNTFADLALSEAPNGPIARLLSLPAPLEAVLFLLRNAAGEHRIPLRFGIGAEGPSVAGLTAAAVGTLSRVIADAVASSPLRVLGGVTNVTGLGGLLGGGEAAAEPLADLEFEPATSILGDRARAALEGLAGRLRSDRRLVLVLGSALGAEDVAHVERFANPAPEDVRSLAEGLRARRSALRAERAELAERTRAELAAGRAQAAEVAAARLGALDEDLGRLESALDELLDLLRPGAERRRERRTREAAAALADRRLAAAWELLVALGGPEVVERIEVRRPRASDAPRAGAGIVSLGTRRR